jgi:hypothetical protein
MQNMCKPHICKKESKKVRTLTKKANLANGSDRDGWKT